MKEKGPPLYPPPGVVIPEFNQDPAHNRRELDECAKCALLIGGSVHIPTGEWPMDPPRGEVQKEESR